MAAKSITINIIDGDAAVEAHGPNSKAVPKGSAKKNAKKPVSVPKVVVKTKGKVPVVNGKSQADKNQQLLASPGGSTVNNASAAARGIRPTVGKIK